MWFNFTDLDRTFAALDTLSRDLQRDVVRARRATSTPAEPPRLAAEDTGDAWVVRAELPGVPPEAVELTLTGQVLRLSATRRPPTPDDAVTHRAERPAFSITRSITLPHKIDVEKVTATGKDGLFEVTLPKAVEAKPRTITVQAR
jgi:HSP20 family protein